MLKLYCVGSYLTSNILRHTILSIEIKCAHKLTIKLVYNIILDFQPTELTSELTSKVTSDVTSPHNTESE